MIKDMEDLITTVKDKDIADYLREAYRCYSASAYRACIVTTNIALFDGLRQKINVLSPVSSVCKEIADEINPLADGQKVFETPLIHRLKAKKIITDLEAERLEQINSHRNKAAHPSGHHPSAEEARFVFSEAITRFLAKDIRQTTYLVDKILEDLKSDNFFPSIIIHDIKSVVNDETKNLDDLAWPALLSKIDKGLEETDNNFIRNCQNFCLGASCKKDANIRKHILNKILKPRLSKTKDASFVSMIINCDPEIVDYCESSILLKLDTLLVHNAKEWGVDNDVTKLINPSNIASKIVSVPQKHTLKKLKNFHSWIVEQAPLSTGFLKSLKENGEFRDEMAGRYLEIASSGTFDVANRFAKRMPEMDAAFAAGFSNQFCFEIIAGVVRAANIGAFSAINLQDTGFSSNSNMRSAALNFSKNKVAKARSILKANSISINLIQFRKSYLL
jgi:hypothetical protein